MKYYIILLLLCACFVHSEEFKQTIDAEQRTVYLLDRLSENHNTKLYYNEKLFTPPMWALIKMKNIGAYIIKNEAQHNGKTYRFSLTTSLIHRITLCDYNAGEKDLIGAYLVRKLKDAEPWIRTESVWGIKEIGHIINPDIVRPLLQDPDNNTAKEAQDTLDYLKEAFGGQL